MIGGRKAMTQVAEPMPRTLLSKKLAPRLFRFASWLLARKGVSEGISTRVHFDANPEAVWDHIMLYEEVPGHPPFLLRTLLPHPVRTEGDKSRVGATVRCAYTEGELLKRFTRVEPPHLLQFEVIKQRLGIEGCILTLGGSYQIHSSGNATDVRLTTNYLAYLRPRFLWRPLETIMVGQLHKHILDGIRGAVPPTNRDVLPTVADSLTLQGTSPGGLACTVSQSYSRH